MYDYYSIEDILAENQKITCIFKVDIADMGHLGGNSERDIKALSKISLPIWLAYVMVLSGWGDFFIPPPFSSKVKNALKAESKSVKLSAQVGAGGSWYGFGKKIMDMLEGQDVELSAVLTKTFHDRLVEVIDQAQHFAALGPSGGGGPTADLAQGFREGLDATERELFALAQESAKRTRKWYEDSDKGRR